MLSSMLTPDPLVAPVNFGMVADGVYRCGLPEPRHATFLDALRLRCVLVLCPEGPPDDLAAWAADRGVTVLAPSSVQSGKGTALREAAARDVVDILRNPAQHPVLVTCAVGRYRTGVAVGCLRKTQRWTLSAILEEYRRFAGAKARLDNEEFIELFDVSQVAAPAASPA